MIRPVNWWWGLVPLALLWIVSNIALDRSVTDDLATRASAIAGNAVEQPQLAVSGRDVTLTGTTFSAAERDRIANEGAAVWGVRRFDADLSLPPQARPYGLKLSHDGTTVTLSGAVPDPAARAAILQAVGEAFPTAQLRDDTVWASGAPENFAAAVAGSLPAVSGLETPGLEFSDDRLTASGRAASADARDAAIAAIAAAAPGFTLAAEGIEAPAPYAFTAERAQGALTLSGLVPDQGLHERILAAVTRLFAGDRVVDGLKVEAGAPAGYGEAVLAGLSPLSRLDDASFSVSGDEARLQGQALYPAALDAVRSDFNAQLPPGFSARLDDLALRPTGPAIDAPACQSEVDILLGRATILFDTGSARISRDSAGLLDRIVATLLRCTGQPVEISGHTDSSGDAAANLTLSQQRAEAVRDYVAGAGIAPDALLARGYGAERPVAPNDSEEGRARNRRIEFTLQ